MSAKRKLGQLTALRNCPEQVESLFIDECSTAVENCGGERSKGQG